MGKDGTGYRILSVIAAIVSIFYPWVGVIVIGLNVGAADRDRRFNNRKARDAFNAAQRDRPFVARTADLPGSIVYGETRVGGVLAFAESSGDKKEHLNFVVALDPIHELDSIGDLYIGDEPLGALDGDGKVTGGRFFLEPLRSIAVPLTSTLGNVTYVAPGPVESAQASYDDGITDGGGGDGPGPGEGEAAGEGGGVDGDGGGASASI